MIARLSSDDAMTVTVSVRVEKQMVPVIGMNLKRVDGAARARSRRNSADAKT